MSRLRNGSTLTGAVLITSLGLFSAVANAQNVEPVPPAAGQQTPPVQTATTAPVKAADETNAAFLARVNSANPDTVALAAAELFKQSPTQATVKDLAGIASSTDAANADMTGKVTNGFPIIAVSTSAAQFSEQVSGLILSDSSQLPTIVALAQKVGNKDFSEVVGEGLALAYSTAMQRGNTILAAAIQLQTKGAGVPSDLLIAFSENIQGTAAGPAAPAAAAGCRLTDRWRRRFTCKRQQHRRLGNSGLTSRHGTGRRRSRTGWRWRQRWHHRQRRNHHNQQLLCRAPFNRQHQHASQHKSRLNPVLPPCLREWRPPVLSCNRDLAGATPAKKSEADSCCKGTIP